MLPNVPNTSMQHDYIRDLIEAYRDHPCLWKVKSPDYRNQELRQRAYEDILDVAIKYGVQTNIDEIKRKLNSLRTSYRRELKNARRIKCKRNSNDNIYIPMLWYYHLFDFLKEQTIHENEEQSEHDNEPDNEIELDHNIENISDNELQNISNRSNNTSSQKSAEPFKKRYIQEWEMDLLNKRFKQNGENGGDTFEKMNNDRQKYFEESDEVFGRSVSAELKTMEPIQRIIAKKVISEVLFHGHMNLLQTNSTFVTVNSHCTVLSPNDVFQE